MEGDHVGVNKVVGPEGRSLRHYLRQLPRHTMSKETYLVGDVDNVVIFVNERTD